MKLTVTSFQRLHIVYGILLVLTVQACVGIPVPTMTPTSIVTPSATTPPTLTPTAIPTPTPHLDFKSPGDYFSKVSSGGIERTFKLHVPSGYQPEIPMPLVLNYHGRTSNAFQHEILTNMSALADMEGFIVVYPQAMGSPSTWDESPDQQGVADVAFTRDLIEHLESQLSIDSKRIYATGLSNGGGMVNRLACDLSNRIAAIAPVAGAYYFWEDCEPGRPVPVVAFHGMRDTIIPYEGYKGEGMVDLPPIQEWAATWAMWNGCDSTSTVTYQHGEVTGRTWENCNEDAIVTLYTVALAGHIWPGARYKLEADTFLASRAIWEFFRDHPMP